MRAVHKKLQPDVDIRDGTAYALPVETGTADAIVVAQVSSFVREIDGRRSIGLAMQMR
jgi:hypothetical protein